MKRRSFVQMNSLIGIGFLSGLTDLFYAPFIKSWHLAGFNKNTVKHLDQLAENLAKGFVGNHQSNKLIKDLLTPVDILRNEQSLFGQDVIFKNISGSFVRVFNSKGTTRIAILQKMPD